MMQSDSDVEVRCLIRSGRVRFAGNIRLKIYGTLRCSSGKRMKKSNRVFFSSVEEASVSGFRPCGGCMRTEYLRWTAQSS